MQTTSYSFYIDPVMARILVAVLLLLALAAGQARAGGGDAGSDCLSCDSCVKCFTSQIIGGGKMAIVLTAK